MPDHLEEAVVEILGLRDEGRVITEALLRERYPHDWQALQQILRLEFDLSLSSISRRVGPCRVREAIGQGSIGRVFQGELLEEGGPRPAGTSVAIKLLHPHLCGDDDLLARLRQELQQRCRAPDHVRVFEVGRASSGGAPRDYIVTELAGGRSLRCLLSPGSPLSEDACRSIALRLGRALRSMHRQGVTHGNLRPENVFLEEGEGVALTDESTPVCGRSNEKFTGTGAVISGAGRRIGAKVSRSRIRYVPLPGSKSTAWRPVGRNSWSRSKE